MVLRGRVLCPTRVLPEIKTCNFVGERVRLARARHPTIIDKILRRSHVKNCFPTGHRLVTSESLYTRSLILVTS